MSYNLFSMCEKNNCFYLLDLSKAPGVRQIIDSGLVKYDHNRGKGDWCDQLTPISVALIPSDGSLDLTCYGPNDSRCPGFQKK
jgi:hypothetical protein